MNLSIIIPAFNEGKKIAADIKSAAKFLTDNKLAGEIIIIDDGSLDNTAEIAHDSCIDFSVPHKLISYKDHRGKGFAVRTGIAESKGDFVAFADSGSCVPYDFILDGMMLIKNDFCDIAHGSRKIQGAKIIRPQTFYRQFYSFLFRLFLIIHMKIPAKFTDTQCGFKIYKGDIARKLFSQCVTDGFMFDIEIILRAFKEGYRIKEFPIEWSCDRDSRLYPAKSFKNILNELMTIKKIMDR